MNVQLPLLHGSNSRRPAPPPNGAADRGRPVYLALIGSLFAVCFAVAAFVIVVDPYDLYPWGKQPRFERPSYDTTAVAWAINALTKSDYDTFYIGASTAVGVRAEDMQFTLPGTEKAYNLATLGPNVKDLQIIMERVAQAPKIRRVIVQLELTFAQALDAAADPRFVHIPEPIYSHDPTLAFKAIDARALTLAWKLVTGQEYFIEEWDAIKRRSYLEWALIRYQTPAYVERLAKVIEANRHRVDDGPHACTCVCFPALRLLSTLAKQLESKGAELDLVFPPYSRAMYYEWVAPDSDFKWNKSAAADAPGQSPMNYLMTMRRCATEALKNAKVFAFDRENTFVGDYANYADPAHIDSDEVNRQILSAIAADQHRVTKDTFADYEREFRERTLAYKLYHSALAK